MRPIPLPPRDAALPISGGGQSAADRRLHEAALAFEALFLRTLVRQMLDSQLEGGVFGDGAGSTVYEGMFVDHLAERLADGSPLGIAGLLESQWAASADPDERETAAALARARRIGAERAYEAVAREPEPAPLTDAPEPAPPAEPAPTAPNVSSAWGWRHDPIDGRRRFHGGIDLPAPEGTPVRSVADGTVVDVASRGGHGLRVVLDHGQGWTTSYSHLSAASVVVGQAIRHGSPLGQVGSSGRATGPHLHLETAREGVREDPLQLLGQDLVAQVLGIPADNEHGDRR